MTGLDLTFDGDGSVTTDLGGSDTIIQLESVAGGKILAIGNNSLNIVITRYNPNGSLDNSFGTAGKLSTGINSTFTKTLVNRDGKIIIAGTGTDGKSSVIQYLANGQPDSSFGAAGKYSTQNSSPIVELHTRINSVNNTSEIVFNQFGGSASINTLLDVNGQVKPFPIGSVAASTPLSIDLAAFNKLISTTTTADRTDPKIQSIINIFGDPFIDRLRSTLDKVKYPISYITTEAQSDGNTLISFQCYSPQTSGEYRLLSVVSRFDATGKIDNSFGENGLLQFPLSGSSGSINSVGKIDRNDRIYLAIYHEDDKATANVREDATYLYRYTKNGQLDITFGNNGKVALPTGSFRDILLIDTDSQGRVLVTVSPPGSARNGTINDSSSDTFRLNIDGTIDNAFGVNGVLKISTSISSATVQRTGALGVINNFIAPSAILLSSDNRMVFGSSINGDILVSKYDIGGTTIAASPTRNDFNGDRKSDILWRSDVGGVALWQMDGATVTSGSLTSTPNLDSSWKLAGTGDFNGDSKSDVLWRNDNGSVALWQMDGATVTASSLTSIPTLDNSWKTAGTGDFNGDGKSDVLWRNANGAVAIWAMDGAAVTASSLTSTPTLDASWKTAGTGDFNGDGKSDILWRNDDGSIALWQMNGANITASTLVSKLSSDWKINGTGDFNGDGKADILWRNDNGTVALWQMDGSNITSSNRTSTPSLDNTWKVAAIDDYSGDGKSDLLWRKDSGSLVVWQMDGSTVVSSNLTSIQPDSTSWKVAAPIL